MSDKTQFAFIIGMLVLLFGSYFGIMGAIGWLDKKEREKRGEPPRFDERQRIARLRAGNHALYALLGFLLLWTVLDQLEWFAWTKSILDMALCALILTWGVWAADCILHDAFVTWKNKRKDADALTLVYCWTLLLWTNPSDSGPEAVDSWLPFLFLCAYVVILSGIVIYKYRKRKKAEAEDMP